MHPPDTDRRMNQQQDLINYNRRLLSAGATLAIFVVTCAVVSVAVPHGLARSAAAEATTTIIETLSVAMPSRSMRGLTYRSGDNQRRQKRRRRSDHSSASAESSIVITLEQAFGGSATDGQSSDVSDCSDRNRKRCSKIPLCNWSDDDDECVPKLKSAMVGTDEESDPCSPNTKKKCRKDKTCKWKRTGGTCHSRKERNGDDSEAVHPITTHNDVALGDAVVVVPEKPAPTLGDPMPVLDAICGPSQPCSSAGESCAVGTETCCGVTHDSLRCTCGESYVTAGALEYVCMYSDACMMPSCCMSGPPVDKPPPAYGTCSMGGLCDTGIEDDYCCYDEMGWAGTYCTKSGGKATTTSATPRPG